MLESSVTSTCVSSLSVRYLYISIELVFYLLFINMSMTDNKSVSLIDIYFTVIFIPIILLSLF